MASDPVILGATIEHLRSTCPPFAGRVAGAADFALGLRNYNENMLLPAAYLVPLGQDVETGGAGVNQNMTGLWQIIDKIIAVTVEFDARPDRRGQAPAMQYDEIEAALFRALLNWKPVECRTPNGQGYAFWGGRFLDLDRARVFYQWEFLLRYQITDEDGWQDTSGEDLCGIELDIYHPVPPWEMPPPDQRPPAVIVKLGGMCVTDWDDGGTVWDDGATTWDEQP